MFQQHMSSLAFRPDDSTPDPARILEEHVLAGLTPDLALDLVLNDLVIRAAEATQATAAALALLRDGELVCRAATGNIARSLDVPLNPSEGLSGVCLQARKPQLSLDTERDPRLDPSISMRLGIRSTLVVPVLDTSYPGTAAGDPHHGESGPDMIVDRVAGVLEVFSSSVAAFSASDQTLLEGFAAECAHVSHAALQLTQDKLVAVAPNEFAWPQIVAADFPPLDSAPPDSISPDSAAPGPSPALRLFYKTWAIVLGTLTVLAVIAVSLLIGSRIGWLRPIPLHAPSAQVIPAATDSCAGSARAVCPAEPNSATTAADRQADHSSEALSPRPRETSPQEKEVRKKTDENLPNKSARKSATNSAASAESDLVVYEKGKVIFRLKPAPPQPELATANPTRDSVVMAASTTKLAAGPATASTSDTPPKVATARPSATPSLWLSPDQAEPLLQNRIEPQYPPEALAGHRAGRVVLEVEVGVDGSVSNIRTLSGDPVLAAASAAAVRNWHYQPYRLRDHPSPFQTDVTLTFTPPN